MPAEVQGTIRPGDHGAAVAWLRGLMAGMRGNKADALEDPMFDADLVRQVKQFQLTQGLIPDGSVGQQTLIRLLGAGDATGPKLARRTGRFLAMSYILDALRKSDQQRQRATAPITLAPEPVTSRPPVISSNLWLALVLLAAGIVIGWLRPWQQSVPAPAPSPSRCPRQARLRRRSRPYPPCRKPWRNANSRPNPRRGRRLPATPRQTGSHRHPPSTRRRPHPEFLPRLRRSRPMPAPRRKPRRSRKCGDKRTATGNPAGTSRHRDFPARVMRARPATVSS